MYDPDNISGADLDAWITGNYGEDQELFDPYEDEVVPAWCPDCGADLTDDCAVLVVEVSERTYLAHAEPDGYDQDAPSTGLMVQTITCVACGYVLPSEE